MIATLGHFRHVGAENPGAHHGAPVGVKGEKPPKTLWVFFKSYKSVEFGRKAIHKNSKLYSIVK